MPGDFHIYTIASNKSSDHLFLKDHKHLCGALGTSYQGALLSPAGLRFPGFSGALTG